MKTAIVAVFALLSMSTVYAQDDGWTLSSSQNGINFYYRVDRCQDLHMVLLKVENTNDYGVSLSFDALISDDGNELPMGGLLLFLQAEESQSGDCGGGTAELLPMPVSSGAVAGITISNIEIIKN